jgi:hypothetical protein
MTHGFTVSVAVFVAPVVTAEIVTLVCDTTFCVAAVKVAVVAPAATVTLAGTDATAVLELVSDTTAPPGDAAAASVTVPVEELPPATVDGLNVTVETAGIGGLTVSEAVFATLEYNPEIVTAVDDATDRVGTVTWVDVAAAGTVAVATTVAADVLELDIETAAPPGGALPVRMIVAVELTPPTTIAGLTATLERAAGSTVNTAVFAAPEETAEIVTEAEEATPSVVTVNVVLEEPAGTVMLAGTVAAAVFELVSVTGDPPTGATAERVTVPVEDAPLTTLVGLKVNVETGGAGGLTVRTAV